MKALFNQNAWLNAWYGKSRWTLLLFPLTVLFIFFSRLRKYYLQKFAQTRLPTPVIVVGNISVGGTGKTPLLIELVKWLQKKGFHPGVVSRGYGGFAPHYPYLVSSNSIASEVGDEPLLIFQRTNCVVCVGPDRVAAAKLLEDNHCDIILSDDGLQHYRLGRDLEIAVVDGHRGLGNGWRLPVGPLRESANRLAEADWIIVNSPQDNFSLPGLDALFYVPMNVKAQELIHIVSGAAQPIAQFIEKQLTGKKVHAVAGIGNPERFFSSLKNVGIEIIPHAFPDHYAYQKQDLMFNDDLPVIMTEKDAVKCRGFFKENWFYLPISIELPESFWAAFEEKLKRVSQKKKLFK